MRGEQAYLYGLKARAQRHHCMGYGTFSVDVEKLSRLRREYSRAIRPVTYVPLYIRAMALALSRNPEANAILFRTLFGMRIVRFERVDVNLPVTRRIGQRTITFIGTIRNAGVKTVAEIQEELIRYQRLPPEESFAVRRFLQFDRAPFWLAQAIHWRMTWDPAFYVNNVGTCGLTVVDGNWHDRVFPIGPTTALFGIGGIHQEPVVREGEIAVGRVMKATLMGDNFVISGLTGSRLARDFKEILEGGAFLEDEMRSARAYQSGV
ncbi:MAG: 2-oxo acid dehydrogenase subunit E2 [Chloroflexi bacterium]|nr:2-oxo acid dehydrogenase subunit E2 [Chloroflexota bacterium]